MERQEISSAHVAGISDADANGYWWYEVRQGHVDEALQKGLREGLDTGPMDYLDLGCGAGGVMSRVVARFAPRHALGLDGTQEAVDIAQTRGVDARYADFRAPLEIGFTPNAVTCLDVLEHLEDPVLALGNLKQAVSPGALLVVTVPAMPSLYSSWDDVCGHFRRYTRGSLKEHLGAGGWRVERVRYAFSWCVPPAWWQRRVRKSVQEMEFPPVSPLVNRAMTWAGTLERRLGSPFPLGTSLVATARPAR